MGFHINFTNLPRWGAEVMTIQPVGRRASCCATVGVYAFNITQTSPSIEGGVLRITLFILSPPSFTAGYARLRKTLLRKTATIATLRRNKLQTDQSN